MKRLACLLVPSLLVALPVVACAPSRGSDDVETGDSALRRLDPSEIVGTIAYGQTKTVAYSAEPRYRAFSFQAKKGDTVDARFAGAKGLDTVGFLLSDSFGTLKQNDDESATSKSSRFTYAITKDGTYYLAVREANEEDGNIDVSLSKVGGDAPPEPPPAPPPSPADVFNPKSCTGKVFTPARAIKYFPKGAATGQVTISDKPGRAYLRARVCSEFNGCGEWVDKDVTKPLDDATLRAIDSVTINTAPGRLQLKLTDRADNPIDVFMTVSTGTTIEYPNWGGVRYWAYTHRLELLSFTKATSVQPTGYRDYGSSPLTDEASGLENVSLYGFVGVPVGQNDLNVVPVSSIPWDVALNETCAQARFSTVKVSAGQQQRVEMQGVVHWDLTSPAN